MALYAVKTLEFDPSTSPDVTGYEIYYCPVAEALSYDSPSVDVGLNTILEIPTDIPEFEALDGDYKLAAVAYDDWGNRSDFGVVTEVPFDFVAPVAPGEVIIS